MAWRGQELDLDGEAGALDAFSVLDELADAARVAFLVEMDHFIHEKYAFRLLCVRYLASRGWRWFGEELDPRLGARTDEYLRTGDETLLAPIDEPEWYTSGILATAPPRPHPAEALAAEQARQARAVRATVPDARWFGFDIGGDDEEYLAMANAAESFEALGPAMAHREQRMHERVASVLDANPAERVALMAGSTHLLKDDRLVDAPGAVGPGGGVVPSIGHHVAQELVDGPVLAIWLLHGSGTSANPWLPPPGRLRPARGTVDGDLARRLRHPALLPVDRAPTGRRRVTQMHNLVLACELRTQVDAVVFVPEVTPIHG